MKDIGTTTTMAIATTTTIITTTIIDRLAEKQSGKERGPARMLGLVSFANLSQFVFAAAESSSPAK
jgi:hypothetical protein